MVYNDYLYSAYILLYIALLCFLAGSILEFNIAFNIHLLERFYCIQNQLFIQLYSDNAN